MLYISRFSGGKIGVMDTDDGKETMITRRELKEALAFGVVIEGVSTKVVDKGGVRRIVLSGLEVYQNPTTVSVKQVKTELLKGISVTVHADTITAVTWDDSKLVSNVCVRLSDYGNKCADNIFVGSTRPGKRIVFVLDDSISIRANTFSRMSSGMSIDITEVTNKRTAEYVYKSVRDKIIDELGMIVIDNPERFNLMYAISAVRQGVYANVEQTSEVSEAIDRIFYPEFAKLLDSRICFSGSLYGKELVKSHISTIRQDEKFWRGSSESFTDVIVRDRLRVFDTLSSVTTLNGNALLSFRAYLSQFKPSERMMVLYVRLCKKANVWLLDYAKSRHWRV